MTAYFLKDISAQGTENEFDPTAIAAHIPFTQAGFYGDWQKATGRKVLRFLITDSSAASDGTKVVGYIQMIQYPLIRGKSYFYVPYGPVVKNFSRELLEYIKAELTRIAREHDAVFVRLDFTPPAPSERNHQALLKTLFRKAPLSTYHSAYFQPRFEWFLDLHKSEVDLLKDMHEKTRYSVRLAERKEITVDIVTKDFDAYFQPFYDLMRGTSERNGFSLHEEKYYRAIFSSLSKIPDAYLAVGRHGDKVLAVDLIIVFSGIATYVFGGSSNDERNRMPTYLAQWRAIQHAKTLGCHSYNFGGVSSDSGASKKIYKGWEGLSSYKKKFGGYEVRHSDFFDIVTDQLWYHIYNLRKLAKRFGI